jgi:hypothetical protein
VAGRSVARFGSEDRQNLCECPSHTHALTRHALYLDRSRDARPLQHSLFTQTPLISSIRQGFGGNKIDERRSTLIGRSESHLHPGDGHAAFADGGGTTFD